MEKKENASFLKLFTLKINCDAIMAVSLIPVTYLPLQIFDKTHIYVK